MTIESETWPTPHELQGVKSRKRPIFEIAQGSLAGAFGVNRVSGLKLSLESRVLALGSGGQVALQLLLGQLALKTGKVRRHEGLDVAHLGPHLAGEGSVAEHLEAALAALQSRPQVVVLEASGDSHWQKAFAYLLEAARSFRGAVVVAAEQEAKQELAKSVCSQCWRNAAGWLWQEPLQHDLVILDDVLNQVAANQDEVDEMLEEVRKLSKEAFFGEDSVQKAEDRDWTLSLLVDVESQPKRFCGFMCYQLTGAEFHVARIAVMARHRGRGHGKHFMQWVLEKCAQLPREECAWISLSALDEAVPFYEQFGFTDMTCDDIDDDEHIQTWMELKNIPAVPDTCASGCD